MSLRRGGEEGVEISVVVPVLNSRSTLVELEERITAALVAADLGTFEVVFVDDGSTDGSVELLARLADGRESTSTIALPANVGQAGALVAGLLAVTGAVVVTLDDDLGQRPEDIPLLVAAVHDGAPVAYGRIPRRDENPLRRSASWAIRAMLGLVMGHAMGQAVSPFRAFDARLVADLTDADRSCASIDLLLARGTDRFVVVPVGRGAGAEGAASRYTVAGLLALAGRMASMAVRMGRRGQTTRPAPRPTAALEPAPPVRAR
ncbi:glycosyltransferase [Aquihabitans sp. McL0605]|uniref:glycosyltransferase n=1 Tax=Aquihabitans sp. McL0605 TaxID=3415671 RepID=UPI003CEDB501